MNDNATKVEFDLNRHMARLLLKEPFFAALSRTIDKIPSKALPTAGVRINNSTAQFELMYNPEFFAGLSDTQKGGVLKHEFYHLIFEHCTGRLPSEGMSKLWNIATDLAINSHLMNELPEQGCFPGKGMFKDFEAGLSAENYFKLLQKMKEDEEQKGEGEGEGGSGSPSDGDGDGESSLSDMDSFDDHSQWGEVDNTENEIAKERLKEAIKKAAEEANQAGSWGSVSASCRKEIMDKLNVRINWEKALRYFVKTSQKAEKRSTVRRINKRFPYIHPGKKINRVANIAISIDQSGSVSDVELNAFFSELNKLADLATFTVIPFDSSVAEDKVYVWKKGEKRKWERVLYGGTCFNAPTEYVNKRNFDGHIVLTDLYAPKPKASRCRRMWMASRYNVEHAYFKTNERIIAIDVKN